MWDFTAKELEDGGTKRYSLLRDGKPVAFSEVIRLWQDDHEFRGFFISLLANSPFPEFRWETPPITIGNVNREFEFVLLSSPGLDRTPDRLAFADHFPKRLNEYSVVSFANLGNDAVLVVPCPLGPAESYVHLGSFVREADEKQKHQLFIALGAAAKSRLSKRPLWISTAGMGVAWLHVRLDSRPKYYGYGPYRGEG